MAKLHQFVLACLMRAAGSRSAKNVRQSLGLVALFSLVVYLLFGNTTSLDGVTIQTKDYNDASTVFPAKSYLASQEGSSFTPEFTLAAGELPGYTGWGRPEHTLAGNYKITASSEAPVLAGQEWWVEVTCMDHAECEKANSWFFVRAYGAAVITGHVDAVKRRKDGLSSYRIRLTPHDPGIYTVEVVITFSNPPDMKSFPLVASPNTTDRPSLSYEGYLLAEFPLTLHVSGSSPTESKSVCALSQLTEQSPVSAYEKARWRVIDQVRSPKHNDVTRPADIVSLKAYQHGFNSLGTVMSYDMVGCRQVFTNPQSIKQGYNRCIRNNPLHIILIGDSVMRLQHDLLKSYVEEHANIRTTFVELYGGFLRCSRLTGPNVTAILKEVELSSKERENRVVVFNTGMHDIHRLCGDTWKKDRTTYLEKDERDKSCFDLYKIALKQLADQVARFPAHLKIFQTTTAAWPKYGNIGVSWSPSRPQKLPLDSGFIDGFNALAFDVLEGYGDSISIVDGYWISLPRPDNRETDINSETGKKLSHPGVEVLGAMQRIWNTLILLAFCDAQ